MINKIRLLLLLAQHLIEQSRRCTGLLLLIYTNPHKAANLPKHTGLLLGLPLPLTLFGKFLRLSVGPAVEKVLDAPQHALGVSLLPLLLNQSCMCPLLLLVAAAVSCAAVDKAEKALAHTGLLLLGLVGGG